VVKPATIYVVALHTVRPYEYYWHFEWAETA